MVIGYTYFTKYSEIENILNKSPTIYLILKNKSEYSIIKSVYTQIERLYRLNLTIKILLNLLLNFIPI